MAGLGRSSDSVLQLDSFKSEADLTAHILSLAGQDGRKKIEINFLSVKELKELVYNIQMGKEKEVPFPDTLEIYLNSNLWNIWGAESISSIEDNFGITHGDSGAISQQLRDKSKILVVCSRIGNAGIGFSRNQLVNTLLMNADYAHRTIYLMLPRPGELEDVIDANGIEEAKSIKHAEASRRLKYKGKDWSTAVMRNDRILVYNASEGAETAKDFFCTIQNGINNMYEEYTNLLDYMLSEMSMLKSGSLPGSWRAAVDKMLRIIRDMKDSRYHKTETARLAIKDLRETRRGWKSWKATVGPYYRGTWYRLHVYEEISSKCTEILSSVAWRR